jgi:hypothetical protein
MMCNTQNYCIFGLYPSFRILKTRDRFGNWICFHSQVGGGHLFCWIP